MLKPFPQFWPKIELKVEFWKEKRCFGKYIHPWTMGAAADAVLLFAFYDFEGNVFE